MFPGGSPELVEPIYKNPLLSAPFNEQLASILCSYVADMAQVPLSCPSIKMLPLLLQEKTKFSPRLWSLGWPGFQILGILCCRMRAGKDYRPAVCPGKVTR